MVRTADDDDNDDDDDDDDDDKENSLFTTLVTWTVLITLINSLSKRYISCTDTAFIDVDVLTYMRYHSIT